MPNLSIKALAFDAYGTLFDVHSVIEACERVFPGKSKSLSQLWRQKQLEYTWLRSLMGEYRDFWQVTEDALSYACRALNLPLEVSHKEQLMGKYLHLDVFPEVPEALQALSEYKLAILSNGAPQMLDEVVRNTGLEGVFAHRISADELQMYKPHPSVYQLAPDRLGVAPQEICFVSSNSFDIVGAKSFGFFTCWINRFNQTLDELQFEPDISIQGLTELKALLPR